MSHSENEQTAVQEIPAACRNGQLAYAGEQEVVMGLKDQAVAESAALTGLPEWEEKVLPREPVEVETEHVLSLGSRDKIRISNRIGPDWWASICFGRHIDSAPADVLRAAACRELLKDIEAALPVLRAIVAQYDSQKGGGEQ